VPANEYCWKINVELLRIVEKNTMEKLLLVLKVRVEKLLSKNSSLYTIKEKP
jgi:hypothetical protein